jgi:hypothetical protein
LGSKLATIWEFNLCNKEMRRELEMPKVAFLGRVFPICYQINMAQQNPIEWKWQEENLVLRFDMRIEQSKVRIECTLDRYKPEFLLEIHRRSYDIVRSAVNLAAFCTGVGYSVVFEHFIDELGCQSMFCPQDLSLARLCTSFSLDPQSGKFPFGKMWDVVVADPALFQALDDLIVSIALPHHSSFNCGRTVEGLRHLIASPGATDSEAWKQMRDALRLDRSFLQLITDTSTAPRHGDRAFIPGTITTEIVRRSWIIMDRFLEYHRGGNAQLPEAEFPLLTG